MGTTVVQGSPLCNVMIRLSYFISYILCKGFVLSVFLYLAILNRMWSGPLTRKDCMVCTGYNRPLISVYHSPHTSVATISLLLAVLLSHHLVARSKNTACSICNIAVCNLGGYITWDEWMMVNNELGKMWKEQVVA